MSSEDEQPGGNPPSEGQSKEEQRRDERVTINLEFESFEAFVHEYVTNVSRTGAFVRTPEPLPVGTQVNLRFTVIVNDVETIEGVGEVVRVQDDPPGMGVAFTEIGQASKNLLTRLLTRASDR